MTARSPELFGRTAYPFALAIDREREKGCGKSERYRHSSLASAPYSAQKARRSIRNRASDILAHVAIAPPAIDSSRPLRPSLTPIARSENLNPRLGEKRSSRCTLIDNAATLSRRRGPPIRGIPTRRGELQRSFARLKAAQDNNLQSARPLRVHPSMINK